MDSNVPLTLQDWMMVVQAIILFLGLGATVWTLRNQKIESKNQSTLNLIIHQRSDKELHNATKLVDHLLKEKSEFSDLALFFDNPDCDECQAILKILNFREFVSVGINSKIIDEETYKRAFYTIMLRDWKNLENTIKALR